jgi:hypothetical protein
MKGKTRSEDRRMEGHRDSVIEGWRDKKIEGQRDKGTKGQRDGWTEGQYDRGTEGQRDRGTEGQRDRGTKGRRDGDLSFHPSILSLCPFILSPLHKLLGFEKELLLATMPRKQQQNKILIVFPAFYGASCTPAALPLLGYVQFLGKFVEDNSGVLPLFCLVKGELLES